MQDAKPGSHTIWDCKYHIVWITKYRFPVLGGDVGQRARELLREIARSHEMTIHAGSINRDYVHMLIGIPPHLSVSRAVQYLKGKSSHKLLPEYKSLRKRYWGQHLWGRGYWVATSGNVPDEVWKKYIEDQKPDVPDDHFNVVQQVGPCCGPPNPAFSRNPKPPPLGGGEFTKAVIAGTGFRECASRRGAGVDPA